MFRIFLQCFFFPLEIGVTLIGVSNTVGRDNYLIHSKKIHFKQLLFLNVRQLPCYCGFPRSRIPLRKPMHELNATVYMFGTPVGDSLIKH